MKTRISVQERLKDLRVERGLNLEELAQETGISKSALGSYENDNDEYKEINHGSLLKLADFYKAVSYTHLVPALPAATPFSLSLPSQSVRHPTYQSTQRQTLPTNTSMSRRYVGKD